MASHRRVRCRPGLVRATGLMAATVAAVGLVPAVGHAQPGSGRSAHDPAGGNRDSVDAVKRDVAQLYQQAEADTQAYDAAEERIARLQAAVAGSGAHTEQLRSQLTAASGTLGRLAAAQYRDAGMSPSMALVFFAHPDSYLARAGMTERVAQVEQQRVLAALRAQEALAQLDRESAADLADLHAEQAQLAAHRASVEAELSAARDRLAALSGADRRAVTAALARGTGVAPAGGGRFAIPSLSSLVSAITATAANAAAAAGSSAPGSITASALGAGATAVPNASRAITAISTAYSELGKPYVWGATGPSDFDCSGLTQHVWAAAGVQLPRTSQEQAQIGPSVPVSEIQPGDLVIYFSGRTHVGLYVGKGLVIHAPRPGSVVQFAPLNSMPIDKVVRP